MDAVARVCKLAVDFRQAFGRDVVVDLVGYRRNGHQEIDNPLFTQPRMYQAILAQEEICAKYERQLVESKTVAQADATALHAAVTASLHRSLEASRTYAPAPEDWVVTPGTPGGGAGAAARSDEGTGVDEQVLRALGDAITTLPPALKAHRVVSALYRQRRRLVGAARAAPKQNKDKEEGSSRSLKQNLEDPKQNKEDAAGGAGAGAADWALAEQLAWGSLLRDGHHVRVSGQDVERGTFSHRHAVIQDQERFGDTYVPLAAVGAGAADFSICNSPLSEYAVLGFELGYSLENPGALVVWEAQFGDFANTAQCIIDQFLCAGESKWQLQTGLVVLLPHGLEGGGPEHSSARLERFLQLCDDDERVLPSVLDARTLAQTVNIQVVQPTTPANFFHLLRRQISRSFRKPLLVMTPKGLLRSRQLVSPLADFFPGTRFQPVLPVSVSAGERARRVILCSGRVSFDLLAAVMDARAPAGQQHDVADAAPGRGCVAVYKLEQLAPFPFEEVRAVLARHADAEVMWCQEEPINAGAWAYVRPRIQLLLSGRQVVYCGRGPSAAPATGLSQLHQREKDGFLAEALR